MSFYENMTALAAKFTAGEFFTDAVLRRVSPTGFDPVTGAVTPQGSTNTPCRAVLRQITTKAADGALVSHTAVTLNVEPKEGDTLTIGTASYVIGEVTKIAPIGTALIYRALVTR